MKLIAIVACALFTVPLLHADDTTKQAKIEELLSATHVSESLAQQQVQLRIMLHQVILKSAPKLEGSPLLVQLEQTMVSEITTATSFDALKPDFIKIYSTNFSEEEIDGLAKFYQSPLGQTMIRKMPAVLEQSMSLTQVRLQKLLPEFQQRVQDLVAAYAKDQQPK
jgi:hypothetical protein